MNQRAFRRALRYGFGRAILYLQRHDAARHRDDILDGCLHDWKFHIGGRSDYMFKIIALTGERAFYRDHILAAVASASDDVDGNHVFALAGLFADEGDEAAHDALDRALERLPFHQALAEHAIALHGPVGLVRVVRLRLDRLDADGDVRAADEIVGWWLIDDATERWGRRAVASAMRDAGRADPRIKTWWTDYRHEEAKWRQEEAAGRRDPGKRRERPILTYEQVKQYLANPDSVPDIGWVDWDTWTSAATDDEWRRLAAELADLRDDDPRWQRAVDGPYRFRAYPGDPHRLIATVRAARLDRFHYYREQNDTEDLAKQAMHALAQVTHPAVRSFALELLETSKWKGEAAAVLERNYVDGDLELLAAVFRRERSEHQRHWIAHAIIQIDQRLAPAGAPPVLLYLYEHVRCEECRADFLGRLHAHAALPAAIANECCFDADIMVRELIAELVPGACTGSGGRA